MLKWLHCRRSAAPSSLTRAARPGRLSRRRRMDASTAFLISHDAARNPRASHAQACFGARSSRRQTGIMSAVGVGVRPENVSLAMAIATDAHRFNPR